MCPTCACETPEHDGGTARPRAAVERPAPLQLHVGATTVLPGSRVRLHPTLRRRDARDRLLDGMTATVETILRDVEHRDCLAVTLDDDAGADGLPRQPPFLYFHPDEVEPLDGLDQ
jgi:hypothetical protein